ncbi:multidrug efflux MFS transporter [Streptacidiphilus sp. 4-A2]|nr:multidrug efflux MFS transporter [Streptacidiphilus sp. 4-A2]
MLLHGDAGRHHRLHRRPRIGASLHTPAASVGLVITAYLLTVATLIPLSGWLAARFGARRILLGAVVAFTLASLACASSRSLGELVAMRVLQGVGGAMMVPSDAWSCWAGRETRHTPADGLHRLARAARAGRGATARRPDHHLRRLALAVPDQPPARPRRVRRRLAAGPRRGAAEPAAAGLAGRAAQLRRAGRAHLGRPPVLRERRPVGGRRSAGGAVAARPGRRRPAPAAHRAPAGEPADPGQPGAACLGRRRLAVRDRGQRHPVPAAAAVPGGFRLEPGEVRRGGALRVRRQHRDQARHHRPAQPPRAAGAAAAGAVPGRDHGRVRLPGPVHPAAGDRRAGRGQRRRPARSASPATRC